MEIIPVVPRGYCKGVYRAIKIAKETVKLYPDQPIYMLGMIVHNRFVVEACEHYNIRCIEDMDLTRMELLDKIDKGVVIFIFSMCIPPIPKSNNCIHVLNYTLSF